MKPAVGESARGAMSADGFCGDCGGPVAWYAAQGWRHVRAGKAVILDHLPAVSDDRESPVASLTYRESSLVQAWADGYSTPAWAASLGISAHTAKVYAARARTKLGSHKRAELVAICMRAGVVT